MTGRVFINEKTTGLASGKKWATGNAERLKLIRQFDEEKYPYYNYFDDSAWVDFKGSYGDVAVLAPLVSFMDWLFGMDIENRMRFIAGDDFYIYRMLRGSLKFSVSERLEYFCLKTETGFTKYIDDLGYEPSDSDRKLFTEWREGLSKIVKDGYNPEMAFLSPPEAFDERFF